jgi:hypothetical protein
MTHAPILQSRFEATVVAFMFVLVAGCSDTAPENSSATSGTASRQAASHPARKQCKSTSLLPRDVHALDIPVEDLNLERDKSYDIRGKSDHTHTVTLSWPHFLSLKGSQPVSVDSTETQGHQHAVRVACE